MSTLEKISFEEQSDTIKDKVKGYWSKRAESFYELRHDEIESNKAGIWHDEIYKYLPVDKKLKILDVGCGTGFFEIILGRDGHEVVGIDLTDEMISKANDMIDAYGLNGDLVKCVSMDAENLDFADETFDVVITRNLTWTLPHPIEAYRQWNRVLKKGGILINFDAEYAKNAHVNLYSPENLAHAGISTEMKDECHDIYHMLTISTLSRPQWDVEILSQIGFENIDIDTEFYKRVYHDRDRFYMLDEMFSIKAQKAM